MKCGLLGEKLGHSYSPIIHRDLADYSYELFEVSPDALGDFLSSDRFDGCNVTIPYKKAVVPYCAELSPQAALLGSVNTLLRRSDGSLYGDNTDYNGFESLIRKSGITVAGKKAIVLGNGGASVTVVAVLRALGAQSVTVISRSGEDNYENLSRHYDAGIIVNATPVGMYPKNGDSIVDLSCFKNCSGVLDIVYNPARTALLLQAEELGIPCAGGLYMLVSQARRSSEIWTGSTIPDETVDGIYRRLSASMQNIVIIGMPGCGKTTISNRLSEMTGRPVYDCDDRIVELAGKTIPEIFASEGEEAFRAIETRAIAELSKLSGCIISTGGGCVTRERNYPLLHQNSRLFCLERDLGLLAKDGRPISQSRSLDELYKERRPMYERFADVMIDNSGTPTETAEKILEALV